MKDIVKAPVIHDDAINEPAWKINSVAKCIRVLKCFTDVSPEWSLTQLAQKLSMPKSTLLNMLKTLEMFELIVRSPVNNTYHLGIELLEMGYSVRSSLPILQYAIPLLEELQEKTGKIIYFTIPKNGKILYLESIYPGKRNIHYSVTGKTLPMHCTGCGKAIMSHLRQEEIDTIINHYGLSRFTPTTITDYHQLMEELRITRERGYAIDLSEESFGVKCVAVPILASNRVLGSISVSGSKMNMPDEILPKYAELLSVVAILMSAKADLFPECSLLPRDY